MFKHRIIDTLAGVVALIVAAALSTSAALAVRLPDPPSGGRVAPAPVQPAEVGPNWGLIVALAVAGVAFIALVVLGTRAMSRRRGTSPA